MKSAAMRSSLPAMATILMCFLVQAVEQGFQIGAPLTLNVSAGRFSTAVVLNLGLLCCLPVIGATGCSLSKRLGYSRAAILKSVLSPVALVSGMLLALLAVDFITTRALVSSLAYSSGILLGWVLIPAGALLVGYYAAWRLTLERPWYMRYI
ncbi:MAG: hypothetical protein ACXVZX_02955 [Terriglobales bacterium]